MTKEENIDYLTLRAEECRFPDDEVKLIKAALKLSDDAMYDHLKRISEPDFRVWCKEVCNGK